MAHGATAEVLHPPRSATDILQYWLGGDEACARSLQNTLLDALDAAEDPSGLVLEALRIVAEATSTGWIQADVRAEIRELLARS